MISQALCNSYKQEILSGIHLAAHEYKIALYTNAAALSKATTAYSVTDEAPATGGYTAGGKVLTGFTTGLINDTAYVDFTADPSWGPGATITARGALIYNNTLAGKNAVAVLDFGSDYSCSNGLYTVTFPVAGETTALIRIL
jgi:hypothetical protein